MLMVLEVLKSQRVKDTSMSQHTNQSIGNDDVDYAFNNPRVIEEYHASEMCGWTKEVVCASRENYKVKLRRVCKCGNYAPYIEETHYSPVCDFKPGYWWLYFCVWYWYLKRRCVCSSRQY